MKKPIFEALLIGAIVAALAVLVFALVDIKDSDAKFREICATVGGAAAHDGRQWQCLGESKAERNQR